MKAGYKVRDYLLEEKLGAGGAGEVWRVRHEYLNKHDRDKSAWWMLIILIPFVGGIWYLVEVGFLKGTEEQNQFGSDPLAAAQP